MTNKTFQMLSFTVLALLVLTSFASAAITLSATTPTTLLTSAGAHTFTITVTSSVADTLNLSGSTVTDTNGKTTTFTAQNSLVFAAGVAQTITMTYNVETGFNPEMKQYTSTFTADGAVASNDNTATLTFAQTAFCDWNSNTYNDTTDLEIEIKNVQVISGFGEDNEWYPQDEVEIEVEVSNDNNDFDIDNIVVEWGVFDKTTGDWVLEVVDENDFSLKDGEKKTLTLTFKLDDDLDEDFDELGEDLTFYVRATGEVDDEDGAYDVCVSDSEAASMIFESDLVVLDNVQFSEPKSCGTSVQLTADVWNIGDSDQEDVYVTIYNKELGINEKVNLGDIDAFDNTKIDTLVEIPQNAEEKTYTLVLMVYNEDNEVYQNGNDDDSRLDILLQVNGGCSTTPLVSIAANLQSEEVKAGQELVVKATITNTGSIKKTFAIELADYNSWATFVSLDKTTVELASKASTDVLVTLKVNEDATGKNTFNVYVKDGSKILSQPVTVTLAEKPTILAKIKELVQSSGDNWYLWGIGALNVILVLVIIFVAIRVVKGKKK